MDLVRNVSEIRIIYFREYISLALQKVVYVIYLICSPKTFEEVVESANTGEIARFEPTEDGVVGDTLHFINPVGNA